MNEVSTISPELDQAVTEEIKAGTPTIETEGEASTEGVFAQHPEDAAR